MPTAVVEVQVKDCEVKLQRADKLIGGLGGERIRWQATVEQLKHDLVNVVGDVVVAAGKRPPRFRRIGLGQHTHFDGCLAFCTHIDCCLEMYVRGSTSGIRTS
jgi:hypothetical protein